MHEKYGKALLEEKMFREAPKTKNQNRNGGKEIAKQPPDDEIATVQVFRNGPDQEKRNSRSTNRHMPGLLKLGADSNLPKEVSWNKKALARNRKLALLAETVYGQNNSG